MDDQNFVCEFVLDKLFALLIPHWVVNEVIEPGNDGHGNKIHHDINRVDWGNDDADVGDLSETCHKEVQKSH